MDSHSVLASAGVVVFITERQESGVHGNGGAVAAMPILGQL